MRIRTRLLLTFLPLIGIPVLVLGVLALVNSRQALEDDRRVATTMVRSQRATTGSLDDLDRAFADERRRLGEARAQALAGQVRVAIAGIHRLGRMAQEHQALGAVLRGGTADQALLDHLAGIVRQGDLTEILVVDRSGRQLLRQGGRYQDRGASAPLDWHIVPDSSQEEGGSSWFRRLAIASELERSLHLGTDADIASGEPVLSLVYPLASETRPLARRFEDLAGVMRVAVPLHQLTRGMLADLAGGSAAIRADDGRVWNLIDGELADDAFTWPIADGLSLLVSAPPIGDLDLAPVLGGLEHLTTLGASNLIRAEGRFVLVCVLLAALLILVVAGAILAFWWSGRELLGPVEALANATRRIAAGDLEAETLPKGSDEINALGQDLERMRRRLKDQIEELRESNRALSQATMLKTQFLANMSHEIRTPMNGVIGMAELLAATDLGAEQRELITTLYRSAEATMHVIDDILDISKIEAGELRLEKAPFNLRVLAEEALRMVAEPALKKGVRIYARIDPGLGCEVIGDKGRLRQVLLNLLSNAVKFTEKGKITLGIAITAQEAEQVELTVSVADTGIGISRSDCERLFQPFVQVDGSTTRNFGGTGLGLAICKQLTGLMGADLQVDSTPGRGSRFFFSLRQRKGKPFARLPELGRLHVLIASGDDDFAENLDDIFRALGLVAERVRTLESAENLIAGSAGTERAYDMVWWDKRLFGDDPTCTIARDEDPRRLPYHVLVVPMTGRAELPELVVGCFDRVFTVPFRSSVVADCLLEKARSSSERSSASLDSESIGRTRSDLRSLAGKVLLVEDNEVNQTVVRRILESLDLDVVVAGNGLEALAALDSESFDLVLMDCQMPHLDGFHTTQELRSLEEEGGHRIPIVALTANAMDEDRKRCLDAGMDAYIAKPVRAETLYLVMRQFLRPGVRRRSVDTGLREG